MFLAELQVEPLIAARAKESVTSQREINHL